MTETFALVPSIGDWLLSYQCRKLLSLRGGAYADVAIRNPRLLPPSPVNPRPPEGGSNGGNRLVVANLAGCVIAVCEGAAITCVRSIAPPLRPKLALWAELGREEELYTRPPLRGGSPRAECPGEPFGRFPWRFFFPRFLFGGKKKPGRRRRPPDCSALAPAGAKLPYNLYRIIKAASAASASRFSRVTVTTRPRSTSVQQPPPRRRTPHTGLGELRASSTAARNFFASASR